jgi:spermidine synthase
MINRTTTMVKLVPLLLLPSGCAALIYQVTWVRLLGHSMGSSSAAVSTVLTAFFLGLAIGSYFAQKISLGERTELTTFVVLELIIGTCGLVLLPVLLNLDHGMALLGEPGTSLIVKFIVTLLVLVIPTLCMGATFPVLAAAVDFHQHNMSSQLSWLYALNTAGAVLGALLSGFVFIPRLGLDGAIYVAGGLNLFVAVAGIYLHRQLASQRLEDPSADSNDSAGSNDSDASQEPGHESLHIRIATVLFLTGFVAIASEVGWTKYLSIFTGATIYGFAAILGVFLTGITLGSWAAKRYLSSHIATSVTVAWGLAALGASLLFARVGLAQLPALVELMRTLELSADLEQGSKYLAVFVVLFPATFVFGALFPVTLSMYCASVADLRRRIGRGYAINTLGSILGAVLAGFWIIPHFGTDVLLTAAVVATLLLAWLFVDAHTRLQQRAMGFSLTVLLLLGSWQLPHLDYAEMITSVRYRFDSDAIAGETPRFLFLEEGKAGVISVVTYDERKAKLQNNGIQESYLGLVPTIKPPFTEVLLGLMPFLLHPDPTSAFVVGFGGGHTVRALADTPLREIQVVELEPAVISAVAAIQGGAIPVLKDSRVQLRFNDARNSLLVEGRNYDLIISQPSHPWLAGAGNLFTREFFEIVAARLNDRGIYTQWVNLFNMDATTLRSILRAYFEVFPHGFTFVNQSSGDLLMFGSKQTLLFDYRLILQRMQIPPIKRALAAARLDHPESLLWYFSLSREEAMIAAADMPANTDTRIFSEVRLAGMRVNPKGEENPYKLLEKHTSLDVLPYLKPDEAARMLFRAGRYFYRHSSTPRTQQALARLESVDPDMARRFNANWTAWREQVRKRKTTQSVPSQN